MLKGLLGGVGAAVATTAVRDQVAAQPGTDVPVGGSCSLALENCAAGLECCGPGATTGTCMPPGVCDNLATTACDLYGCPGITICCDGVCSGSVHFGCPVVGDDDDDDDGGGAPTTTTMAPSADDDDDDAPPADDDDDDAPPADDDDDDAPPADDDDDDDDVGSKPPQGTGSINTLPNTGSGSTASGNLAQLGATLAASAAAVAAARMLRQQSAEDESTT